MRFPGYCRSKNLRSVPDETESLRVLRCILYLGVQIPSATVCLARSETGNKGCAKKPIPEIENLFECRELMSISDGDISG